MRVTVLLTSSVALVAYLWKHLGKVAGALITPPELLNTHSSFIHATILLARAIMCETNLVVNARLPKFLPNQREW